MCKKLVIIILLLLITTQSYALLDSRKSTVILVQLVPIPDNITPKIKIFEGSICGTCENPHTSCLNTLEPPERLACFLEKNDIIIYKKETCYNPSGYITSITIYYGETEI